MEKKEKEGKKEDDEKMQVDSPPQKATPEMARYGIPNAHLSPFNSMFLEISQDKLSCKYIGKGSHAHDYGSIRSSDTFSGTTLLGYYEVTVVKAGKGAICVGLAKKGFPANRQPGKEADSYGYSGLDGRKFGNGRSEGYSDSFTTQDVVGCGIIFETQQIFFTKNGQLQAIAFNKVKPKTLYPTIGLHSPGAEITVNFGQDVWCFDVLRMVDNIKTTANKKLESIDLPLGSVHNMICDYLAHYGYESTLQSFLHSTGDSPDSLKPYLKSLPQRKGIRNLILNGQIKEAIEMCAKLYPQLFTAPSFSSMFYLQCQFFIELIKAKEMALAIQFAQNELMVLLEKTKTENDDEKANYLEQIFGLMAYSDLANSPLSCYTSVEQRERIGDIVNQEILTIEEIYNSSTLERRLKELSAAKNALRLKAGGKGEIFNLRDYVY